MIPLDDWSARRTDLYLTRHNTHTRQISMPPAGFEPTIPCLRPCGYRDRPEWRLTVRKYKTNLFRPCVQRHISSFNLVDTTNLTNLSKRNPWSFFHVVLIHSNLKVCNFSSNSLKLFLSTSVTATQKKFYALWSSALPQKPSLCFRLQTWGLWINATREIYMKEFSF